MSGPTTPHARLRAATAASHEAVDAAFGGFDLTDRAGYVAFLTAHARALSALETVLTSAPGLPSFRPRTPALMNDLARLDAPMPPHLPYASPATPAAHWGALYVVEGSRLGGVLLARSIPAAMPRAYLSAAHLPGEWRAFLTVYDAAAADAEWEAVAIDAARATFDLYAEAACRKGP